MSAGLNGGTWLQGCSSRDCLLAEMLKQGALPFYHHLLRKGTLKADFARGQQMSCVLVAVMVAISIRSRIPARYRGPSITNSMLSGGKSGSCACFSGCKWVLSQGSEGTVEPTMC